MLNYKLPDVNLTAYGLLDHGATDAARQYIQGVLSELIQGGMFVETINIALIPSGVQESLFSAMNLIEFTWLLNDCRYDGGAPKAVELVTP